MSDLDSSSGTYVNDKRITRAVQVKHGDRLRVGPLVFRIMIVQEQAAANTPVPAANPPVKPTAAKAKPATPRATPSPGRNGASDKDESDEEASPTKAQPAPVRDPKSEETSAFQPADSDVEESRISAAERKTSARTEVHTDSDTVPARLGGYQVIQELGRGGMGMVFLGRQISLDRPVALKVMHPRWAKNPTFVARFAREAYAAAQLVHHNVVQVYDVDAEGAHNFFSMEFVKGKSLGNLLEEHGKLDAEVAVNYVLQAARGLKFGHDLGMVHRDVKPDNLLLNDHGIVKVADLGLVKIPRLTEVADTANGVGAGDSASAGSQSGDTSFVGLSDITRAGTAMGTAAYMAPEQARNAAELDCRADIYSLGCTLYVLLTGRLPFDGKTSLEVLSKHASEPLVPPDVVAKRIPKALSGIVVKMMAKKPEDRYANLAEVIGVLEKFLGLQSKGPFSPSEKHVSDLEECVSRFNGASLAPLRMHLIRGFFPAALVLLVLCLLLNMPLLAGGVAGLVVLTPLCHFIIRGVMDRTYLFFKVRELALSSGPSDWLMWLVGALLFFIILYLLQLLFVWIAFCVLAALAAGAFYFLVDRRLAAQRENPLARTDRLLSRMRLEGLDEEILRQFVCKYSGQQWEEFFEALFGYEAKLAAREWSRGEAGRLRQQFAAWRDPLVRWINVKLQARREAKDRKHLQAVEEKALKDQGMAELEARQQAQQVADAMVAQVAELKEALGKAAADKAQLRQLLASAKKPETLRRAAVKPRRPVATLFGYLFAPRLRFLTGAVLVATCLLWMNQNDLFSSQKLQTLVETTLGTLRTSGTEEDGVEGRFVETESLELPGLPVEVADVLGSFNAGAAGLILLLTSLCRGWKIGLGAVLAAVVAVFGHRLPLPALRPLTPEGLSMAMALVLIVIALLFFRERRRPTVAIEYK